MDLTIKDTRYEVTTQEDMGAPQYLLHHAGKTYFTTRTRAAKDVLFLTNRRDWLDNTMQGVLLTDSGGTLRVLPT